MASKLIPELIYCSDGNARFARIAIEAGFTYGAQLPNKVYFSPEFTDQNWRRPDLEKYLAAVAKYRPRLATVLDWERAEQLPVVLAWAETISAYVESVIIIPKVVGGIRLLPKKIGGMPVRLGYSVPSGFSGTPVGLSEFSGWPIHLLGGSPNLQRRLAKFLDVVSLDGNYHLKMATRYNQYFVPDGSARGCKNRFWPALRESNGQNWGDGSATADAPYEAFRRSCEGIMNLWREKKITRRSIYPDAIQLDLMGIEV